MVLKEKKDLSISAQQKVHSFSCCFILFNFEKLNSIAFRLLIHLILALLLCSNERDCAWKDGELDGSSLWFGFHSYSIKDCEWNALLCALWVIMCLEYVFGSDASCREVNHLNFRCDELRIVSTIRLFSCKSNIVGK